MSEGTGGQLDWHRPSPRLLTLRRVEVAAVTVPVAVAVAVVLAFSAAWAAVVGAAVVLALGALAAIFVLIRIISIPDSVLPADGRGIGIWISLVAALGVIAGGLLRAAEEL
jgi:hypothetical protein